MVTASDFQGRARASTSALSKLAVFAVFLKMSKNQRLTPPLSAQTAALLAAVVSGAGMHLLFLPQYLLATLTALAAQRQPSSGW
jgi:hypothetical protein